MFTVGELSDQVQLVQRPLLTTVALPSEASGMLWQCKSSVLSRQPCSLLSQCFGQTLFLFGNFAHALAAHALAAHAIAAHVSSNTRL